MAKLGFYGVILFSLIVVLTLTGNGPWAWDLSIRLFKLALVIIVSWFIIAMCR